MLQDHIDGLVQERCSNSSVIAMQICLSCANPSILEWPIAYRYLHIIQKGMSILITLFISFIIYLKNKFCTFVADNRYVFRIRLYMYMIIYKHISMLHTPKLLGYT